ncbi:MAG TPA: DUF6600 domain-containing protein [Verrucomicrobiae bacterium]|jgi:hypothetical protein|nr:DUF6600 domain-containing protein [Verrucomicrobiae bacterium]
MKIGIKISLCFTVLMWATIALPAAHAQSPQPVASPPTLPADTDTNGPIGQVIRMLQSGDGANAILADITNSKAPFDVNTANLIYLNDLGAPSGIETALIQRNQKLGVSVGAQPAPSAAGGQTQESQDITEDYFYGALAPYGTWVNMPGYGLCWQPDAANYSPGWTPYCTLGQWTYTDSGWYWLSGYSWGWCVFHYGRWFHDASRGWLWRPSTTWGPSWVFWRYSGGYCGWAPLPPHAYYSEENGLTYNSASIGSTYDFGIGANLFSFVPMAKLFDANIERFRLSAAQSADVFAKSTVLTAINSNDRIIVNDGIPLNKIAAATHGAMRSLTIRPVESVALPGARGEQILPDGETLVINRPYFIANSPSAIRQGITPVPSQEQPVAHRGQTFIVNENPLSYPPASSPEDSVIYVNSAAQNGPPVPTVTTAGPQDYASGPPAASAPEPSYWAASVEAPAPVDTASVYMSPRSQSHEHSRHKVRQPDDHRDFNPPTETTHQSVQPVQHEENQHEENHAPVTDTRNVNVQVFSQGPRGTPTHTDPSPPSAPSAPAHAPSSSPPPGHDRGH